MNVLLQNLDRYYREQPEKTALMYSSDAAFFTYRQLDEYSARVYRYLKERQIGREGVVLIHTRRGIQIIALMVGIWKAGAAVVVCEDSMSPDRVRYIAADCGCSLVIGEEECAQIMETEPLSGRETVAPHDAAYIVYTSGSTGNPKGVTHEYGNIEESIRAKQLDGKPIVQPDELLAVNSPLNFVAALDYTVNVLNAGAALLLMDTLHVKNPGKLIELYDRFGVTGTFMTPSLYRVCGKMNPQLRFILLGGEPCTGLFDPEKRLINGYNLSEAGRDMCLFPIDRAYELTPIGHNRGGEDILLLDEDGQPVKTGEVGELCFRNEYVRGYIGLPEKTAASWRGGLFHSGDMASRDADGEITLRGRNDDMIKIDGNRIEPAEIENAAKAVLKLSWAAAKGFITPERSFTVLYYTEDLPLTPNEAREVLHSRLPQYMLPSYFVHLDEVPMLPNGKLDRKKLLMPDIHDYRKPYVPASSLLQQKLCGLFEKILGVDRVGIDDDFYELGGDSVKSLQLITEAEEPDLDVAAVYRLRTVRQIAETLENSESSEEDLRDSIARTRDVKLNAFETFFLDYQLYAPSSTLCNMPKFWKMKAEDVDVQRLLSALYALVDNHPAFRSVVRFNDRLELVKHYDASMEAEIHPEYVTETELEALLPTLIYPFRMLNSPLYRIRVFCTEANVYLFLDVNHVVCDGTSLHILEKNLSKAYHGEVLNRDCHYLLSQKITENENGAEAARAAQYNDARYGSQKWVTNITPDHFAREDHAAVIPAPLEKKRSEVDVFLQQKNISLNVLCVAAALLMLRRYENCQDVMVSWLFNGRQSMMHANSVGLYIKDLPVAVSFNEIRTADELLRSVKEQTVTGVEMSADAYVIRNTSISRKEIFRVRKQGDLLSSTCIEGVPFEEIALPNNSLATTLMDIQILEDENGEVSTLLVFNDRMIEPAAGQAVSSLFGTCVSDIISGNI